MFNYCLHIRCRPSKDGCFPTTIAVGLLLVVVVLSDLRLTPLKTPLVSSSFAYYTASTLGREYVKPFIKCIRISHCFTLSEPFESIILYFSFIILNVLLCSMHKIISSTNKHHCYSHYC